MVTRSKNEIWRRFYVLRVQNECIYRAPFVKSLGSFTDENLDWEDHVGHVLVSSGIPILKMSKNYLPQGTLKILHKSSVETHFHYDNIIRGN